MKRKLLATRVAAVLLAVATAAPSFAEELLLSDGLSEPVYEEEIYTDTPLTEELLPEETLPYVGETYDEGILLEDEPVYEEPAPAETPVELLPEEDFFAPEGELTDEIVITDEVLPEDELSEELFANELPEDNVDTTEYIDTYEAEDPADTAEDYVADEDSAEDDAVETENLAFDEPVLIEEKFTGDENPTEIISVVGASDDVNAIFGGIAYTRTFNYPNSWTYEAKDANGVSHTYKLECEPGANVTEMGTTPEYYLPPESCGFKVYCDGELFTDWTQNQYDSNGVKTPYETYRQNHTADAPYSYLEWEIRDSANGTIKPDGSFYFPLIGKVRTYLVPIKQPAILTYYGIAGDEIAKDANGNYMTNSNKLVNGVPGIPCVPWTGKPIVPTFVTLLIGGDGVGIYGGVPLTQQSYWPYIDVTYENNTNPGIAKAIFKGKKGSYLENFYSEAPFRIVKEETATPTPAPVTYTYKVTIPQTEYTYTGKEIKPAVTVTWTSSDGKSGTYTKGKDFGVTYTNNINVGTATIKITAMGRAGLDGKTLTFKIVAKTTPTPTPVSYTYTVSGVNAQYTYTGSAIKPTVTVKANGNTLAAFNYTVTYSNNTNVGTATVKVVGKGTHSDLNKTITFKIVKPTVTPTPTTNTYTVSGVNASYEYTGKAITPKVIVSANGTQLSASAYTVTYSNNINAGTATVKIVGKGIFSDLNKTLTFKIVKNGDSEPVTPTPTPTPEKHNYTFSGVDSQYTYTGSAIKPTVTVKLNGTTVSASNYTVTYSNNVNAGTATIKIVGKGSYSDLNKALTFKIVKKKFIDVTNPADFFYEPIYWATDNGIATGFSDNTFRPNNDCNRASVVTFLWRLAGKPDMGVTNAFSDMTGNSDFDHAITWAAAKGITTGYKDGTFRPYVTCNRAAIVTFFWRYAGRPQPTSMANFSDMTGNDDFDKAISWAGEKSITTGYTDGTFRPWNQCARLAVATFLHRYAHL